MLKGNYDGTVTYDVGDVVKYANGVVYVLQYPCKSGIPPTQTRYWGQLEQPLQEAVLLILDALELVPPIPTNISEDAIILKSSTEDSDKEFIITVDDDGEITATELEE